MRGFVASGYIASRFNRIAFAKMKPIYRGRINRRSFIKHSFRFSVVALVGFMFGRRNNVRTEHLRLKLANLPSSFNGFRVVQISDLHASLWVRRRYLMRVIDLINALEKDLVVITGDIITAPVNDFWKKWIPSFRGDYIPMVVEVLSHLREGLKLAVRGNHDQWDGKETEECLVSELERIDVRVLRDRSEKVSRGKESLYIGGTDDFWFSYDLNKALRNIPKNAFKILLSHNPDVAEDIPRETKVDLTLCGHTHGGQIAIPFLSRHFVPIKNPSRYLSGLVKEPYGYTYVNRGIGTLVFPFRLGAPPEITCFTLQKA